MKRCAQLIDGWDDLMTKPGWLFTDAYPAKVKNLGYRKQQWYVYNRHGAKRYGHGPNGGPAIIVTYIPTGVIVLEEWRKECAHRPEGPARICRDRETGRITAKHWFLYGAHSRKGGPAIIKYDRISGARTYEAFWEEGKKISETSYIEEGASLTPKPVVRRARVGHGQISHLPKASPA